MVSCSVNFCFSFACRLFGGLCGKQSLRAYSIPCLCFICISFHACVSHLLAELSTDETILRSIQDACQLLACLAKISEEKRRKMLPDKYASCNDGRLSCRVQKKSKNHETWDLFHEEVFFNYRAFLLVGHVLVQKWASA